MTENCVENTDFAFAATSRPGHMPRQLQARLSGIRSIENGNGISLETLRSESLKWEIPSTHKNNNIITNKAILITHARGVSVNCDRDTVVTRLCSRRVVKANRPALFRLSTTYPTSLQSRSVNVYSKTRRSCGANSNLHESVFVEHPGTTQERWHCMIALFSFHKGTIWSQMYGSRWT